MSTYTFIKSPNSACITKVIQTDQLDLTPGSIKRSTVKTKDKIQVLMTFCAWFVC
ncbi:Hypothetical predicted protein [Mytilus galloprovincialis]|uniref:Uncharacterized protein n=1 Tax=Mytilus galloprovincialis TaxID=29158 RepID=A0A8B6E4P5_MYTGA|nr:Hypothetical predicted protein [Mytilus galloprovincialis]